MGDGARLLNTRQIRDTGSAGRTTVPAARTALVPAVADLLPGPRVGGLDDERLIESELPDEETLEAREEAELEARHRRAAEHGDIGAMSVLGTMLLRRGDLEGAEPHLRGAAAGGDRPAANNLGLLLHQRGYAEEAAAWWRIAAVMRLRRGRARARQALPRARRRTRGGVLAAPGRRVRARPGRVRAGRPPGPPARRRRRALVPRRRRARPPRGRLPARPHLRRARRGARGRAVVPAGGGPPAPQGRPAARHAPGGARRVRGGQALVPDRRPRRGAARRLRARLPAA